MLRIYRPFLVVKVRSWTIEFIIEKRSSDLKTFIKYQHFVTSYSRRIVSFVDFNLIISLLGSIKGRPLGVATRSLLIYSIFA